MKKALGIILRGFGYLIVIVGLAGVAGGGGTLALPAAVAAIAISRWRARIIVERRSSTARSRFTLVLATFGSLLLGWLPFIAVPMLAGFGNGGAAGAAAVLGGSVVVVGVGLIGSIDIPLRRPLTGVASVHPVPRVPESSPGTLTTAAPSNRSTNAAALASLLLLGIAVAGLYFYLNRGKVVAGEGAPVRMIAVNDALAEIPADEKRRDVVHALVIMGNDWVTFDGGWRNTPSGQAAALRFAVFEGKRRNATSLQLGIRPRYDRDIRMHVYETANVYGPDGRLVYTK